MAILAWPLTLALALAGGASHMTDGFAYSRDTLAGIPGQGSRTLETTYFIYVLQRKGAPAPRDASVWLKGEHHAATVRKVDSPVLVEHDPVLPAGKKDTLVPVTPSDVYQIVPGDPLDRSPADEERQAVASHDVVVCLSFDGSVRRVTIKTLQPLRPAPGR
ncbi:MAG TPA: hypothetical protein VFQ51_04365 [Vicinamibacteria bacterium]|nr:hypothetical protein [Vicinamibacteria bacterium]